MDVVIFSLLLILVICIILSFLFLGWKKGLIISIILIILFISVFTYLIVKDVNDLQKNIMTKDKLFVLKDGKKVISAFSFSTIENIELNNTIRVMKLDELNSIENDLNIGYTKDLKSRYYKIIVFNKEMFNETIKNGLNYDIGEQTIQITKTDFDTVISSNDPSIFLMNKVMEIQGYNLKDVPPQMIDEIKKEIYKKLNIDSTEQIKGYAFILLIADYANEKGMIDFIYSFKNEKIEIYPKTPVFRLIDIAPKSLIDKIVQKVNVTQGDV